MTWNNEVLISAEKSCPFWYLNKLQTQLVHVFQYNFYSNAEVVSEPNNSNNRFNANPRSIGIVNEADQIQSVIYIK